MNELEVLSVAASGMDAQRIALETAARNVAAAQTSTPDAFARLVPQFAGDGDADEDGGEAAGEVRLTGFRSERGELDTMTEMVSVLDAQRAYEANASVFDSVKRLAERTLELERA